MLGKKLKSTEVSILTPKSIATAKGKMIDNRTTILFLLGFTLSAFGLLLRGS